MYIMRHWGEQGAVEIVGNLCGNEFREKNPNSLLFSLSRSCSQNVYTHIYTHQNKNRNLFTRKIVREMENLRFSDKNRRETEKRFLFILKGDNFTKQQNRGTEFREFPISSKFNKGIFFSRQSFSFSRQKIEQTYQTLMSSDGFLRLFSQPLESC